MQSENYKYIFNHKPYKKFGNIHDTFHNEAQTKLFDQKWFLIWMYRAGKSTLKIKYPSLLIKVYDVARFFVQFS